MGGRIKVRGGFLQWGTLFCPNLLGEREGPQMDRSLERGIAGGRKIIALSSE